MPGSRSFRIIAALSLISALCACDTSRETAPVIGRAYAGPATLNLHKEIDSK
jgi:hypothetical protein